MPHNEFYLDDFDDKEASFFDISELLNEVEEEDLRIEELKKEVFKKTLQTRNLEIENIPYTNPSPLISLRIFPPL